MTTAGIFGAEPKTLMTSSRKKAKETLIRILLLIRAHLVLRWIARRVLDSTEWSLRVGSRSGHKLAQIAHYLDSYVNNS